VVIRKKGHKTTIKTFRTKTDARSWAKRVESGMEQGEIIGDIMSPAVDPEEWDILR
jgi:hypothetical protein